MPDRIYLPINSAKYSRRDRLWSHWYAFCATLGGAGLGLLISVATLIRLLYPHQPPYNQEPPWEVLGWERWLNPAPSLAAVPDWQGLLIGLLLFLGGIIWTVATLVEFRYVEDFWKVLRGGLLMLVLGWAAYVFCAANMRPEWIVPWWLGTTNAIAYSGGFYLSMVHQWRLKGYPAWVLRLSETFGPPQRRVERVLGAPARWLGNRLGTARHRQGGAGE